MMNQIIILRSYLHITTRKRNDRGKLVNNALTKDLKLQEGDFLRVEMNILNEKHVKIENTNNELMKTCRCGQFYRMLTESCDFEEYLII